MKKILAVATHATDDPTKSSLAFITAVEALGAGIDVGIALLSEGGGGLASSLITRINHSLKLLTRR